MLLLVQLVQLVIPHHQLLLVVLLFSKYRERSDQ